MTATSAAWLLVAAFVGYLAHALRVALDPRGVWNCGYDAGWADGQGRRRAREGPGPAAGAGGARAGGGGVRRGGGESGEKLEASG
jgi:hypothetical protein